jgi:hypothetical protein
MRASLPVLVLLSLVAGSIACGKKGDPRVPEPRGPHPPIGVEARQAGDEIRVAFTVPSPRGNLPNQEPVRGEVIRVDYAAGTAAPPDPDAFRRRGELVASFEGDPLEPGSRIVLTDSTLADLPDGAVGRTFRYGVRVLDRRGRSSPLVVAMDLVPVTALLPPSGLRGEATADGIRLAWEPPPGEGPFQYHVYRTTEGGSFGERPIHGQPLDGADYLDDAVTTGSVYLYHVTHVLGAKPPFRESTPSDTLRLKAEDRFPPARPTGLIAVQEGTAVRLLWDPNTEPDLAGYRVWRAAEGGAWEQVGDDPVVQALWLDRGPHAPDRIRYRVTAVDRASPPNESEPSDEVEVEVVEEPVVPGGGGA